MNYINERMVVSHINLCGTQPFSVLKPILTSMTDNGLNSKDIILAESFNTQSFEANRVSNSNNLTWAILAGYTSFVISSIILILVG